MLDKADEVTTVEVDLHIVDGKEGGGGVDMNSL